MDITENNYKPGFIVLEGIDGSGKGTQSHAIQSELRRRCNDIKLQSTQEPTDTDLGNFIRNKIRYKLGKDMRQLALLFAADRVFHVEDVINPALRQDNVVICDRYVYSSLAYQGQNEHVDFKWICELNYFATPPDLVFILDIPVREAMIRFKKRNKKRSEQFENMYFFLEKASDFFKCLSSTPDLRQYIRDEGMRKMPDFLKTNFILIDATVPKEQMIEEIFRHIEKFFEGRYESRSLQYLQRHSSNHKQTKVWDYFKGF